MDSVRQQKYSRLIQKELGEIFQREGRNWYGNQFITVTGVRVTPDLGLARIQLSMFKAPDPKVILKALSVHKSEIKKHLSDRIGKQARIIPELEFFHDDSLDYVEKMEGIFKNLHIPKADETKGNDEDYKD
jgi:ribosome-binding factor A